MDLLPPNEANETGFALFRLFRRWQTTRVASEGDHWIEAYLASVGIYLITYLFAATFWIGHVSDWKEMILLLLLLPGVWIFWLIVLYLNSLIVKAVHALGFWRNHSRNRVQGVLVVTLTTCLAMGLAGSDSGWRWLGIIWVGAVVMNLIVAISIALPHAKRD